MEIEMLKPNKKTIKPEAKSTKSSKLSKDEKYHLYLNSVQNAGADIDFINKEYKSLHGRLPLTLREDFCGTGMLACEWTQQSANHKAYGVDLDIEPISYGVVNHWQDLSDDEKTRMKYLNANVLRDFDFKTEVIVAFNFSYFLFKERNDLLNYFKQARKGLKKDGTFFIDLFGGLQSRIPFEESVKHKNHTYYWDCAQYNPISNEAMYYIHFKTHKDGVKHEKVFKYDWRMWDLRELTDILKEAGFSKIHTYWEGVTAEGEGNGVFKKSHKAENCDSWISYICAQY